MRKLFSAILLFSFSVSSTSIAELLKIPQLIYHFNEHQKLNSSLSFNDFLAIHYSQPDDGDGDQSSDEKLPFKSTNQSTLSQNKEFKIFQDLCCLLTLPDIFCDLTHVHYKDFIPEVNLNILIQPPKS